MNKIILIAIIMAGLCCVSVAQNREAAPKKRSCSCGFTSISNIGYTEGGKGNGFLLQTINGFHYKTWFAGAGVGLDYYHLRGIPVFLDLRKTILNKPSSPFIYADYGIHYPWARDKDKKGWAIDEFKNGKYYDIGIGIRFHIKNTNAVLISIGYSYKSFVESLGEPNYYCPGGDCPANVTSYSYKLNRLSLKAGWQF